MRAGLAAAVGVYLLYSSFGLLAPFWWGHHGYHGAQYLLRARMSLRLHTIYPITWSGFDPTYPSNALYFHHPIGLHHLLTLTVPIFGEHEWLARMVGVTGGLVAIWSLYRLVARFWCREGGLVAVIVFVALPILTSFSVLCDAMLWEMAAVLWMLHAYLTLFEKPERRALVIAGVACALGGLFMWEVYFIAPFLAVHALYHRFTRTGRALRVGRFNALTLYVVVCGVACAVMLAFHVWLTWRAGAMGESIESYNVRKAAPSPAWVLDRHDQWIHILYGEPPVVMGALWLTLFLARLAAGRARRRDLAPLTFLYVNVLYYYLFAEGSAVHLYRVFFYSGFFTLAITDLVIDSARAARRLFGYSHRSWAGPALAVLVLAAYLAGEVPHAYANLLESRELMGTHGQLGYNPEREKTRFAQEVHRRTGRGDRVIIDYRHLGARKELWYYLDRSFDEISYLSELSKYDQTRARSVLILDFFLLDANDRLIFDTLVREHPVTFFGRYAMVDLRSKQPGVTSFAFADRRPSRAYRWWVSHKYPPIELQPSVFLPGVCAALDAGAPLANAAEALPAKPTARSQLPCWHNLLVERGDQLGAAAVEKQLLEGSPAIGQSLGGARVLGADLEGTLLRVAYLGTGPEAGELRYTFRPQKGAPTSFPRTLAPPPQHWRNGFIYVDRDRAAARCGRSRRRAPRAWPCRERALACQGRHRRRAAARQVGHASAVISRVHRYVIAGTVMCIKMHSPCDAAQHAGRVFLLRRRRDPQRIVRILRQRRAAQPVQLVRWTLEIAVGAAVILTFVMAWDERPRHGTAAGHTPLFEAVTRHLPSLLPAFGSEDVCSACQPRCDTVFARP